MVSTTDDAEHSWRIAAGTAEPFTGIGVDDSVLLDQASQDGGSPALHGHPGGPGFPVPDDGPPAVGRSVWQRAQAAWRSAGQEWRRPADGRPAVGGHDGALADPAARFGTQPAPYPPLPGGPAGAPAALSAHVPAPRLPSVPGRPGRAGRRRPSRTVLLAVAIVVVVAAGTGGYLAFGARPGTPPAYPAARLAGAALGAGQAPAGRGVFSSLTRVVSKGDTAVAVGSQSGGDVPRAQFFISRDGGNNWKLARVRAAGGAAPPPGHAAQLIAAGRAGWLAVGPQAVWTSRNGQSWTLTSATGISPADTGDQVWVLTQTAGGFLAAGENAAEGTGVIWTSANGKRWRRMTAAQLSLTAGGVRVTSISFAAAHGKSIVISGEVARSVSTGRGRAQHTVVVHSTAAWLSTDGGTTWKPVTVPADHGASGSFSGIAAAGAGRPGFIAVRPGSTTVRHGRQVHHPADGVVYASATGSAWHYAGTLTAPGGLDVGVVKGGDGGFTVLGETPGGTLGAYASTTGASWRQAAVLGSAATSAVTGATVTASGAVIAAGGRSGQDREQPFLAVAPPGRTARAVDIGAIHGATITQVAADAIGVSGGQQVAVGEAGGSPAIWTASGRGPWSPVAGLSPASPAGQPDLRSVVHGPAGWLATGGTGTGTAARALVFTSPDGATWQSAGGNGAFAVPGAQAAQAVAGRSGYVIVGSRATATGTFPAAWSSAGLSTWSRASGLGGVPGQMLGGTATASGFVAAGLSGVHPAVWTSPDGRTWHQTTLPVPGGAASAELLRVTASGGHLVAAGDATSASGAQAAFAEVSADGGTTWRQIRLHSPGGSSVVTAAAAVPGGFTVVGGYGAPGSLNVAVWTSANGTGWTVKAPHGAGLSGAGIQEITGLAAEGGALTGVGFTATATAEQPTLWHVPASLVASLARG